jgi:hypothetical protein
MNIGSELDNKGNYTPLHVGTITFCDDILPESGRFAWREMKSELTGPFIHTECALTVQKLVLLVRVGAKAGDFVLRMIHNQGSKGKLRIMDLGKVQSDLHVAFVNLFLVFKVMTRLSSYHIKDSDKDNK